jgi:RNA polymerase sigma-70 factor (ECF subfamily)
VLVREFDKYDKSRPFLPWALGIARNVVLMSRRDAAKSSGHVFNQELLDQIESAFHEDEDAWSSARAFLNVCLDMLPQKSLEILRWTYAEDLKPSEVANRMGITSGAVRVKLHRARVALQKCIRRHVQLAGG